jgi:hypothetical protein
VSYMNMQCKQMDFIYNNIKEALEFKEIEKAWLVDDEINYIYTISDSIVFVHFDSIWKQNVPFDFSIS